MPDSKLGTVRIAPSVLAIIVSLTAESIRGVAGMSAVSRPPNRVLGRANMGTAPGVSLTVRNGTVGADVYIVAEPDTNLRRLGQIVQQRVHDAMHHMVDITTEQVNVFIEDVKE